MDGVPIDAAQARAALHRAAGRTAQLLNTVANPDLPVPGSSWTIGEVGAHLVVGLRGFTNAAGGSVDEVMGFVPDTELFPDRLGTMTQGTLTTVPERDPRKLADLICEAAEAFLGATASSSGSERISTPWYRTDASLTVAESTCLLLGEEVVHGFDIARAIGVDAHIDPEDARLILSAAASMLPFAVNRDAARGVSVSYDVSVRGGPRFTVRVTDGSVVVDGSERASPRRGRGDRVDCHIVADPVAFLLVGYGRTGQWGAVRRGRLLAWGRKPWLGLRFKRYFHNP